MSVVRRPMSPQDWEAVRVVMRFLQGRLQERSTLEWALQTRPHDAVQRSAILEMLDTLDGRDLREPWRSAWRLVQEHWAVQEHEVHEISAYRLQHRIAAGERTGALVQSIVSHVAPRLDVSMRDHQPSRRTPRSAAELLQASLTSDRLHPLEVYALDRIDDVDFLEAIARALEGAMEQGLSVARRLGWRNDDRFWRLGDLRSVAYQAQEDGSFRRDVDEFHRGIAPSVKLLHAVIRRMAELDAALAGRFVRAWRERGTPMHLRLWAALALDTRLITGTEIADVLGALGPDEFWNLYAYPEIAELRASRFADMPIDVRSRLEEKLMKGAPFAFWRRRVTRDRLEDARRYWALREMRRIEIGGGPLSAQAAAWLHEGLASEPQLAAMISVRDGFSTGGVAQILVPRAAERYDTLSGEARLRALETALSSTARSWDDDPAESAAAWIQTGDNAAAVLTDLETLPDGHLHYAHVLDRLGWAFSRPSSQAKNWELSAARRMLAIVNAAPDEVLATAIEGVTFWLAGWSTSLVEAGVIAAWFKLWPLAVVATNASATDPDEDDLAAAAISVSDDYEPRELDTLNDPAGRLVGVFLELCPDWPQPQPPFAPDSTLVRMREAITSAPGKAGLIGLHRLVEQLPYFLAADSAWTEQYLIQPLRADDAQALTLWRAVARRAHYGPILSIIGPEVAARALDRRLGRERRDVLLSSLIVEGLYALLDGRLPAVAFERIQQTIREVDDEVRARSAQTLQRFLSSATGNVRNGQLLNAESVFDRAIEPFLRRAWPPERSLATRGVAAALADLPAAAGDRLAQAVTAIDPFLTPFDCWSMADFGFWGETDDGRPQLARIDTSEKAVAFLRLLDATVGDAADSIVPMNLGDALEQINLHSPASAMTPAFRRLAALARRR